MEHKGTKVIETERLILRPFRMEDAEPVFRNWASDPRVTKFLTWPTHESVETTEKVLKDWVEKNNDPINYQWAIELKEIHEPVGSISAVKTDDRTQSATVGYCVGYAWWG
ncbi:MAG: GNAT family N-acetyltransferase, partial [Acetatifactor sp.]|nr:GNAT family N-acetyltransferase [Acetatifactor sp.]